MLLEVAGDTAGGFVILPGGQPPEPATYQATTWEALAATLERKSASAIDIHRQGCTHLAGRRPGQDRHRHFDDGVPRLPTGRPPPPTSSSPTSSGWPRYGTRRRTRRIVMLAAARCGLPTAEVFYEPHDRGPALSALRPASGQTRGSWPAWFSTTCASWPARVSEKKYEKEGGPGIAACAELIRNYSSQPAVDLRHFVGGSSSTSTPATTTATRRTCRCIACPAGACVTPFYDLMCTRISCGLLQEFALSIGDEAQPGRVAATQCAPWPSSSASKPAFFVLELAQKMALKIRHVGPNLPPAATR